MPLVQAAIPGLNRMARTHLAAACEAAFDQVMSGDHAVYVVRQVAAKLAIASPSAALSEPIARGWAERIAGAATRVLAHGDEGIDFVRFEGQADFVARFLVDLVQPAAGRLWFYGAFRRYLELPMEEALVQILEDNSTVLNQILRLLRERGHLELILSKITAEGAIRVGGRARQPLTAGLEAIDAYRPLLAAALGIAEALGAVVTAPPAGDLSWYYTLPGSVAAPALPPDWKDPIQLASCVAGILYYLNRAEFIRWPVKGPGFNVARATEVLATRFDWLPLAWLIPRLSELWGPKDQTCLIERPSESRGPTPRQRQFLDVLYQLATEQNFTVDFTGLQVSHDSLRIRSVLVAAAPQFAGDPQLLALLESILLARRTSGGSTLPVPESAEVKRARIVVETLGPTAQAVVRALEGETPAARTQTNAHGIATEFGALFLLTRGVIDLRLDAVLKSIGVTSSAPFLAALAAKIGSGALDSAARCWAGYEGEDLWGDLSHFPIGPFQNALFRQVVAQRHVAPNRCGIEEIEWRGKPAAVCGDSNGIAWPLASLGTADDVFRLWSDLAEMPVDRVPQRNSFFNSNAKLAVPIEACPPGLDLLLAITAGCVLRAWGRWLRGIGDSTPEYLFKNTLDRKALVHFGERTIDAWLAPAPLDSIVDLSGYFATIPRVPWLGHREMRLIRDTS